MEKRPSDQDIGKRNAQIVGEYVDMVLLEDVPLNQFNGPSIEKILTEILGLRKSARYNPQIKAHFVRLADRLKSPEANVLIKEQGVNEAEHILIKQLKKELNKRDMRIATLQNTIVSLRQEICAAEYVVETGRLVRR